MLVQSLVLPLPSPFSSCLDQRRVLVVIWHDSSNKFYPTTVMSPFAQPIIHLGDSCIKKPSSQSPAFYPAKQISSLSPVTTDEQPREPEVEDHRIASEESQAVEASPLNHSAIHQCLPRTVRTL